jgi:hypothetical protein
MVDTLVRCVVLVWVVVVSVYNGGGAEGLDGERLRARRVSSQDQFSPP